MTQQQLADASCVALGTIRKIERGERGVSDATLDSIADALGIDPVRLRSDRSSAHTRVHDALPALSAAIAAYDLPDDGPVRPTRELHSAVNEVARCRLAAQYTRIAREVPELLMELSRAFHLAPREQRSAMAELLIMAYRSADAVAFKFGAHDLSARLVELMRWAVPEADDPLLTASVAYVRTETFFASHRYATGLRALEQALDSAPPPDSEDQAAARGALHMRAAVIAGRARNTEAALVHLDEARVLADRVHEQVYYGTAFGPDSTLPAHSTSPMSGNRLATFLPNDAPDFTSNSPVRSCGPGSLMILSNHSRSPVTSRPSTPANTPGSVKTLPLCVV
jgi:transcriptional regulator with XRE-family HTH domain